MQRRPSDLTLAGAVDLSRLAKPAGAPAPTSTSPYVFDVDERDFEELVLRRSLQVPVLIDFWADWCGPCKQLTPVLERLADEMAGAWVLAKVDTEANQAIAAQLQIQSIPAVFLALGGRLVPGFQGALPEAQLRAFLEQVLAAAEQAGIRGEAAPEQAAPPPADPDLVAAEDALAREDYAAAVSSYDALLARSPGDPEAVLGRAWAVLLQRAAHLDPATVLAEAQARPDDVAAQTAAADVEVLSDRLQDAIDRLVALVRRTAGEERDAARLHLLELFSVLDQEDERVLAGRRSLANALY
ncbi:MAG TPA: tetratricopeptide repeat protein [Mycobacteriales bacterium]|jgi:putative thioredoxin|nr:tetratricopeptide repeat protein [Mycobacteriales bacterium]